MKEKIARPRIQDKTERKSKYIETLMQKAKEREREHEIVYEKKLLKERSKDDHLYADKEKFVTSAYKKQLAEREKWMEDERLRQIREEKEDALEEDPSVFDYDGVFDDMKEKIARPRIQDKTERKSKYIETLMQKAKEREREHEIFYKKKLLKERSKDDHLYADKEKFVTSAYKKQLAEREKWMEEERLRQIREEKEDITKKKDLSEFYFGLNKNVAFGGGSRWVEPTKPSKPEVVVDNSAQGFGSGSATKPSKPEVVVDNSAQGFGSGSTTESNKVHRKSEAHYRFKSQTEHEATTSKAVTEDVTTSSQERKREGNKDKEEKLNQMEEQSNETAEVYKRSEAAVVAARERFLTRKRARKQL